MNKYKLALFGPLTMPLASFPDNVGNVSFYQSFYLNNSKAHCLLERKLAVNSLGTIAQIINESPVYIEYQF